ncbi:MAG: hypothetical protein K0Q71_3037, partial [Thermomicrobiales bacterium]|nr:hypothetical protein [Thermomicrobiales bacterium]
SPFTLAPRHPDTPTPYSCNNTNPAMVM